MAAGTGSWKMPIHTQNKSSNQTRSEAIGSHSIEYEPDLGEAIDSQQGV